MSKDYFLMHCKIFQLVLTHFLNLEIFNFNNEILSPNLFYDIKELSIHLIFHLNIFYHLLIKNS